MTPSAHLQTVIELLTNLTASQRPADALLSSYFRSHRYIGSKDRAVISEKIYGILRFEARLSWFLGNQSLEKTPRQTLLAYLILIEKIDPQEIAVLGDGKKYSLDPLTKLETRQIVEWSHLKDPFHTAPPTVRYECPTWAYPHLMERFGGNFPAEMIKLLEPAPLDLRVNSLKISRESIYRTLLKEGFAVKLGTFSPYALRLSDRPSLAQLSSLKNGELEIQDEGSQLVALLVDPKPGERVVDFCAGAGGKSLLLAAQMNNKGRITALDIQSKRLKQGAERYRKAGISTIETRALSSENDPWIKRHKLSFDRVLVDAPCSGTGTWRRNPDTRWRSLGPGLEALLPMQARILASASRLLKPGGRLVYATCSLVPLENERQIESFLKESPEFRLVDYHHVWNNLQLGQAPCEGPYLNLTPAQHDTDGFFAAVLERNSN